MGEHRERLEWRERLEDEGLRGRVRSEKGGRGLNIGGRRVEGFASRDCWGGVEDGGAPREIRMAREVGGRRIKRKSEKCRVRSEMKRLESGRQGLR